jgi:hypothetical protein
MIVVMQGQGRVMNCNGRDGSRSEADASEKPDRSVRTRHGDSGSVEAGETSNLADACGIRYHQPKGVGSCMVDGF